MTPQIRRATPDDIPEIERVMRASMAKLATGFYDESQTASAVQYGAVLFPRPSYTGILPKS